MNTRIPLGLPEVAELLDRSPATREAILVGGQALNVLAVHHGLDAIATAVSYDIDFFGDATVARDAGHAWGGRARVADIDDHTPNTALVLVNFHGQTHQIDFMGEIMGVQAEELKAWAATIEADGKTFRVMHPLHVLQSQLENVYGVLNRRAMGTRAVARARLSIQVAERTIRDYLDNNDKRAAFKAAERVAEISTHPAALRAWYEDNLDVLAVIPAHPEWPSKFTTIRLPQIHDMASRSRNQYVKAHKHDQ